MACDVIVEEEFPYVTQGHVIALDLVPWHQQHLRICVALDVRQPRVRHQGILKQGDVLVVKTHTYANVILEQILSPLKLIVRIADGNHIIAGCH